MFIGEDQFYFGTVRKITIAFATLFKNISVARYTNSGGKGPVLKTIKVPLVYAKGERWYVHRTQDIPAQEKTQIKISLPRIGIALTGMQYDQTRKLVTMNKNSQAKSADPQVFLSQLNPVPYDFAFEVYIAARNADDAIQIVEQILPRFAPSFNLTIKDIPELNISKDIPIIFGGISMEDVYEGSALDEDTRIVEWTLTFVAKGYLYPPIADAKIIREVIANLYKDKNFNTKTEVIATTIDPSDAEYDEPWEPKTTVYTSDELDSNGDPI